MDLCFDFNCNKWCYLFLTQEKASSIKDKASNTAQSAKESVQGVIISHFLNT